MKKTVAPAAALLPVKDLTQIPTARKRMLLPAELSVKPDKYRKARLFRNTRSISVYFPHMDPD